MVHGEFSTSIRTADGRVRARFIHLGRSTVLICREDVVLPAKGTRSGEDVLVGRGAIAVPRRMEGTSNVQHAIYPHGLFEALRGCLHATEGYGVRGNGELRNIHTTDRVVAETLRMLWLWGDLDANQRQVVEEHIADFTATSERWRAFFKRVAADRFEASLYVEDTLGRKNPGATALKLSAARRSLAFRLNEIATIVPWLGYREACFLLAIDGVYATLETAWGAAKAALTLDRSASLATRVLHAGALREAASGLAAVPVEPFLTNLGEASREFESAARHLVRARVDLALRLIARARDGLRFKFAQFKLEELLRHFSIALDAKKLADADITVIVQRLQAFRKRLPQLRDLRLRHNPYPEIAEHLETATAKLDTRSLEEAREAMKAASHAM